MYEINPGIVIGEGNGHRLEDFVEMSFEEWKKGKPFLPGMENREYTCPAWWYQNADHKKEPNWDECWESLGSTFSNCKHFSAKEKCRQRWDKEFNRCKFSGE